MGGSFAMMMSVAQGLRACLNDWMHQQCLFISSICPDYIYDFKITLVTNSDDSCLKSMENNASAFDSASFGRRLTDLQRR